MRVRGGDLFRILGREAVVGLSLGLILGGIGFSVVALVYGLDIAQVIGLTLVLICTLAAVVGGVIPLAAKALTDAPAYGAHLAAPSFPQGCPHWGQNYSRVVRGRVPASCSAPRSARSAQAGQMGSGHPPSCV